MLNPTTYPNGRSLQLPLKDKPIKYFIRSWPPQAGSNAWIHQDLAIEENHTRACNYIREAASQGAELAVLPEYHLNGWAPDDPLWAEQAGEYKKYLSAYQALAKELHICLVPGSIVERHETEADGKEGFNLYNTAYFISNDGSILGSYQKKNIWHPERPHLTSSGEAPHEVFDTPIGKVGLLICWDLAFPEAFRELIASGAEVVIIPTFYHQGTRHDASPEALSYNPDSEALFLESTLTSRCFENTCAIVFVNAAGADEKFLGMSRVTLPIVGPVGKMGREEGVLVVDMDMGLLKIAEENYRVREDMAKEGWHYVYRHSTTR
ncbi:hydrolase, carbon-nitrogen family, putative [Aspergillus fumigatus A1163]|uniref:Hydrolase, carbon-nitrogen family, putative n=1 Tax=Aspergillus fumigatus (strain CBS 144.89 / FGSC A1163 / CEA10) TaxID=451804 RepID=B0Y2B6_ASPFC|nr:hydrolase, carbon-nitrogen family, putative [Aspergillus fumigatus A1163]